MWKRCEIDWWSSPTSSAAQLCCKKSSQIHTSSSTCSHFHAHHSIAETPLSWTMTGLASHGDQWQCSQSLPHMGRTKNLMLSPSLSWGLVTLFHFFWSLYSMVEWSWNWPKHKIDCHEKALSLSLSSPCIVEIDRYMDYPVHFTSHLNHCPEYLILGPKMILLC